MKRNFLTLTLALIVGLFCGSAFGQANVFITGGVSPEDTPDTVLPGDFMIDFWYQNSSGIKINGYSATWRIYSPDSVTTITYRDVGSGPLGLPVFIDPTAGNGWRPSFVPGEYYWPTLNDFTAYTPDGTLPDTLNHTAAAAGQGTWPAEDTENLKRFSIAVTCNQEGTICVDSIQPADPIYNWLWADASPTWNNGEPYCFVVNDPTNAIGDNDNPLIPIEYALDQNYPNPFNPTTTIDYAIKTASHVELSVFNVLGQKIKTLVDQEQPANYYSITWNGDTDSGKPAASGIYFYEIKAGDFEMTKKMMLLK